MMSPSCLAQKQLCSTAGCPRAFRSIFPRAKISSGSLASVSQEDSVVKILHSVNAASDDIFHAGGSSHHALSKTNFEMSLQCRRLVLPDGTSNGVLAKIGISDGEMVKVIPHKATGAFLSATSALCLQNLQQPEQFLVQRSTGSDAYCPDTISLSHHLHPDAFKFKRAMNTLLPSKAPCAIKPSWFIFGSSIIAAQSDHKAFFPADFQHDVF